MVARKVGMMEDLDGGWNDSGEDDAFVDEDDDDFCIDLEDS